MLKPHGNASSPALFMAGLLAIAIMFGFIGVVFVFFTDRYKLWAEEHLDRHKTTAQAMFSLAPDLSPWEPSQQPTWLFKIQGVTLILMSLFCFSIFIALGIRGHQKHPHRTQHGREVAIKNAQHGARGAAPSS